MAPSPLTSPLTIASDLTGFSPMAVHDLHHAKRDATRKIDPSAGAIDPNKFDNKGVQFAFALLGILMCMGALWFFFWAKNGGFKWQENDWEDYKSTVLRRKGPDGKTLSNATKSTRLGGGSVVHGGSYGAPTSVGYTDEPETTVGEMREVEEGKGRKHFGIRGGDGENKKDKKKAKKGHEHDNNYKDAELRAYRDERPARVGGLNREADGMYTDYSATGTEPSELGSELSSKPLVKDKDKPKESEKERKKRKEKEARAKEQRAKERMRKAKLAEKEAAKTAAAEAKAKKEAEKEAAKKEKAEQKKSKKTKSEVGGPSGPALIEYPGHPAAPQSEYTAAPKTEYTAPSEVSAPTQAKSSSRRAPPSAAYSFVTGDDRTEYTGDAHTEYTGTSGYTDATRSTDASKSRVTDATKSRAAPSEAQESSYYSDYRPNAERSRESRSQSRPRKQSRSRPSSQAPRSNSQSPRKQHRSSHAPKPSNESDIFTAANGDTRGNMSYPCHIPGLSTAGSVSPYDSVSQAGAPRPRERAGRDVMAGYRRGGVRTVRRDSLSDSDS